MSRRRANGPDSTRREPATSQRTGTQAARLQRRDSGVKRLPVDYNFPLQGIPATGDNSLEARVEGLERM
jgi:hypothetical protein